MKVLLLLFAVMLLTTLRSRADQAMTYSDITRRLYDLKQLAVPPAPGEVTGSVTSHDRRSTFDATKGAYIDWGANDDFAGFERQEGDSIVAADLKGPGVIWRIWSAQAYNGHIKIVVDGADHPALDVPFHSLFDADHGPFPYKELVRNMAGGYNCFVPIAFQKSCKVLLDKDWGRYYQITYSRFPDGTQLPSFHGNFDATETAALVDANRAWAERGDIAPVDRKSYVLKPGKSVDIFAFDSPQAITGIVCSVDETEDTGMTDALREVAISCYWDGEPHPSVWSPLGDFFGSGPGLNPFRSLPSGVDAGGMYARWYMPFNKAIVRLTNDGKVTRRVSIAVQHEPLPGTADGLLRFHAKWHRDHFGVDGPGRYAKDRWPDWPMLLASSGQGRLCGIELNVWNPLHVWNKEHASHYVRKVSELCPDPNWFKTTVMTDWWYGEGDEKFFVDGEPMPSTFGTGTEDYFGFAWGTPQVFDSATQCQTRNTANEGHISLARWHIADNVPFQQSFEAAIEKYHGNNWPLLYAVTAYWYQAAGVTDQYPALPVNQREGYYTLPELAPRTTHP